MTRVQVQRVVNLYEEDTEYFYYIFLPLRMILGWEGRKFVYIYSTRVHGPKVS